MHVNRENLNVRELQASSHADRYYFTLTEKLSMLPRVSIISEYRGPMFYKVTAISGLNSLCMQIIKKTHNVYIFYMNILKTIFKRSSFYEVFTIGFLTDVPCS